MVDQQTMERVIEAGRNQPIGVIAILLVVASEAVPFLTGARIDTGLIDRINGNVITIERGASRLTGRLESLHTKVNDGRKWQGDLDDDIIKSQAAHRDLERMLASVRSDVTRALADIKDVNRVVTSNAHLFDILDMRLNQIKQPYNPRVSGDPTRISP